jgi:segregation and condensation protein B
MKTTGILPLKMILFRPLRMSEETLIQHIEALLFVEGGAVAKKNIVRQLNVSAEELAIALHTMQVTSRGLVVVDDGTHVSLRTSPSVAEKVEEIRREEFSRDIGRAGLEVLAAIMYRGPLTRSEIDFIRGVNSSQTVRTLLMRGFVRRVANPRDERSFLYEPTTEILAQLGITSMQELPEYGEVRSKLLALEEAYRNKEQVSAEPAPREQSSI